MTTKHDIEPLFRTNYAAMLALAGRLLHDEDAARDIVHDVFARLLTENIALVSSAYLLKAVRNSCLNHIRDLSTRDRINSLYALDTDSYDDKWPDEETIERLHAIIDRSLTAQCGNVVRLRFTEGMSYREISTTLGISEVAVYKHLRHALDVLRQKFRNNG